MSSKLKPNKLKNTGLIFELLMRQIASDTLENKESKAVDIIRKFFANTELAKEYRIYKALSGSKNLSETKGNLLISTAVSSQRKLNQTKLRKEKYSLISEIKNSYDLDNFFKTKLSNYKLLGSIYMLFEMEGSSEIVDPETAAAYKFTIMESLVIKPEIKEKDEIFEEFKKAGKEDRLLVYKILVNKFNEKYKGNLNESQKLLLKEYVNNVSSTPKLTEYINNELVKVKSTLRKMMPKINDAVVKIKVKQICEIIKEIPKSRQANDDDVLNLFNHYELIDEITKITDYFKKATENV